MKNGDRRDADWLTPAEVDSLCQAIGYGESGGGQGRPRRFRRLRDALRRLSPAASHKHLINTTADQGDLEGVAEIWFNDRIQVPIWAGPDGRLMGFRVYPEQELRRRGGHAPFLEWSERSGYASSSPHPRIGWVRRQLHRGSHGGFGAAQPWGDTLREVLRRWPRDWDSTRDMRDNGSRLAGQPAAARAGGEGRDEAARGG